MGTIRFVLRTDKVDKRGTHPVQLVYQISGQRKYFTSQIKIRKENWNADLQTAVYLDKKSAKQLLPALNFVEMPTSQEIVDINTDLVDLRRSISDIERKFKLNKIVYSAQMVIDELKADKGPATKKEQSANEIYDFIDKYVVDNLATRKAGSLAIYKALKQHLQDFQKDKRRRITFEGLDYSFFMEFQNYLINEKKLSNTTVAKHLSTTKTFINYARMHGVAVSEKYRDFKIKKETLEVIALTLEEFETLINLNLKGNTKLDQVRDAFCFSCATGLRYSDLKQLEWYHIKKDEIRLNVQKTSEDLTIPLNQYSAAILSKYSDYAKPLKVISNQKMNTYLKELCKLADLSEQVEIVRFRGAKRETNTYPKYELISAHTGRKTFATLSLEKGMSAEEVMTITGHRDYKSFKRYVKITEKRKKVVMAKAWGEAPSTILRAV